MQSFRFLLGPNALTVHSRHECEKTPMISTILWLAMGVQASGNPMDSALIDGDKVHIFLPPILVSEGRHLWSTWSSDGMYLLVASENVDVAPKEYKEGWEGKKLAPRDADLEIHSYSMRSGTSKRLYQGKKPFGSRAHIVFFLGTDVAIVNLTISGGSQTEILRVTCGSSKVEIVDRTTNQTYISIDPSGQLIGVTDRQTWLRFIGKDGKVYPKQQLPAEGAVVWDSNKDPLLVTLQGGIYAVNPNGGFASTDRRPSKTQVPDGIETRIATGSPSVGVEGSGPRLDVVMASVRQTERWIPIAYDARNDEVSPTSNGVFFTSYSLNMVRPVVEISKAAFDEMLAKAERNKIMAEVSQIGRALLMFSADNDGAFPTEEQLANRAIDAYLQSPSILSGFVYSGVSGNLGASETQMGYKLCPGGRAVLFQDGHVTFVPNR